MTSPLHCIIFINFSVILEDLKLKCSLTCKYVSGLNEKMKSSLRVLSDGSLKCLSYAKNFTYFSKRLRANGRARTCTFAADCNWLSDDAGKPVKWKEKRDWTIVAVLYLLHFIRTFDKISRHTQRTHLFFRFCMNFSSVISSRRTKSKTPTSCSRIVMVADSLMYVAAEGYELFQCKANISLFLNRWIQSSLANITNRTDEEHLFLLLLYWLVRQLIR